MTAAFCQILLLMLAAHFVCDWALQPAGLSIAKRPGGDATLPWPLALAGHSLIHGGGVAAITGLWWLGVAETLAHAAIDRAKTLGQISTVTDQALHLACKLAWAMTAIAAGAAA